jgi:mono/diheme cytochrome c family protein
MFAACGGGQGQQQNTETPESMVNTDSAPPSGPLVVNEDGKKVYDQYCVVCHMADGQGVPNAFPPLAKTEYVNGDTDRLIGIVLNGLTGEIEVNGAIYNNVMVAHNFLSDQEVADVITYVRSSFGNDAPAVNAEQVATVRNDQ